MQYLSYEEYSAMGGRLSQAEFDRFSARAECEINNATLGRLKDTDDILKEVKACIFELITYLSNIAQSGNAVAVSAFGNDGYSVTYTGQKTAEEQINDIIYTYLADTDLLYCGVC